MSNVWERFESIASKEEVNTAKDQFTPIAIGDYEAILENIEPSESKDGLPMLKGKFRTVENRILFYNQMLQNLNYPSMTAINIAEAVTFVGGLIGAEVEFNGLGALADTITKIPVGGSYTVNVSYGKKDFDMKFPKLKIVEILTAGNEDITPVDDGDIPF